MGYWTNINFDDLEFSAGGEHVGFDLKGVSSTAKSGTLSARFSEADEEFLGATGETLLDSRRWTQYSV